MTMARGARRSIACLLVSAGLAVSSMSNAQQFSADLVAVRGDKTEHIGSLRVAGGKARIESYQLSDGFFLIDPAKPAAYFVRPRAHVFMDARQSSSLTQMFVPVDPDEPCAQWHAMASLAASIEARPIDATSWRCERDGEGTIGGRRMDVYRIVGTSGSSFVGWVDRERRFPLQIKVADGTMILVDSIRDAPQSAQSFDIPPGVQKFDPQALIRRIQQSDVWVAPPGSE